ncbi:anti-sigma F factor antagonist [Paenibacillus larvae subsp. larvae]|uniref:Anti-sigma F factor antagonist n=1 Tax=Paenibacillus larvae subsp. larvae TaxID=147375 RepID=A0A2L1UC38_9BACL|nr:anti-sigma F factor antagonist [Paenibacillus larvae subsp. larvae]AVG11657.1 anti-sigma F factor antagonist [Paenibacillus larvae subsp. larvae DSM 25430]ETK25864.1 anti-sigma F factor antagonist [Paenibacillus larvae subsp. larvae DSM 25719]AVF25708.1 anti-sigma F factor antagonist [Paenibacillus larvae subsp. larvae]AVF30485.1 anti-sigma F factor antagonist [Paenibacillus larvae subsp. larvae]
MTMSLQIEFEQRRRALIVRLQGELDHHTADMVKTRMEEAIAKGDARNLVLSLRDLSFMDSSGLGVILGRYKQITGRGGKMIVCDVNPSIYRLFELSGLFKIVAIEDNERKAISSLEVAL